jgi:oligopeptide transport system ATP-binding protein
MPDADRLLDVNGLCAEIPTRRGVLSVVDGVSFRLDRGECLGIVGESGSGKSMTCRALLGLLPQPGRTVAGEVLYRGQSLLGLPERELTRLRGKEIAVIVQDAVAALNPVWRIGTQISEAMIRHGVAANRTEARARAIALMRKVGIPAPDERIDAFPHQFSGGMCQRVVIATALACDPQIIIADEPTTALDVTIQDQILKLLLSLQADLGLGILLVTHDMGVVAQTCDRVAVMYAAQIVETADTGGLFRQPRHPYTAGLLSCVPRMETTDAAERLYPIPGLPPDLARLPQGCRFHPRCPLADEGCRTGDMPLVEVAPGHHSRCRRHEELVRQPDLWATASDPMAPA